MGAWSATRWVQYDIRVSDLRVYCWGGEMGNDGILYHLGKERLSMFWHDELTVATPSIFRSYLSIQLASGSIHNQVASEYIWPY